MRRRKEIPTNNMQAFDLTSRAWRVCPPMPEKCVDPLMLEVNGRLFVLCGRVDVDDEIRSNAVYAFDPTSETWTRGAGVSKTAVAGMGRGDARAAATRGRAAATPWRRSSGRGGAAIPLQTSPAAAPLRSLPRTAPAAASPRPPWGHLRPRRRRDPPADVPGRGAAAIPPLTSPATIPPRMSPAAASPQSSPNRRLRPRRRRDPRGRSSAGSRARRLGAAATRGPRRRREPSLPTNQLQTVPWGLGASAAAHDGRLVLFGLEHSPPLELVDGAWSPLPQLPCLGPGYSSLSPQLGSLPLWC